MGAGRQHQGVIADALLTGGGADQHLTTLGVNGRDVVAGADVQVERRAQRVGGLHQQLGRIGDLAPHEVGQPTVGERDVLAAFQDDDVGRFVQSAGTGSA